MLTLVAYIPCLNSPFFIAGLCDPHLADWLFADECHLRLVVHISDAFLSKLGHFVDMCPVGCLEEGALSVGPRGQVRSQLLVEHGQH